MEAVCLPQQSAAAVELWHQLTSAAVSLTEFQQMLTLSSGYQQQICHCSCPHKLAETSTAQSKVNHYLSMTDIFQYFGLNFMN